MAATSKDNAWAVGEYYDPGTASEPALVEHWNGKALEGTAQPRPD